ncbi:MAG: hypothetical protein IPG22_23220 [Acidobacteria bacterium]|nr:hypothetical protein [Acidobacteriota bacterium]
MRSTIGKVRQLAKSHLDLDYGKAIAGSNADRETEAKVFRWIYDALDGKRDFWIGIAISRKQNRRQSDSIGL